MNLVATKIVILARGAFREPGAGHSNTMQPSSGEFLGTLALLAVILGAGCIGGTPQSDAATPTPDTFESPAACTGNETSPEFDLPDGPLPERAGGFELTVNESSVTHGEPVTFTLRNVAVERRYTGTKAKYILQQRTEGGWETVTLLREPHLGFNATAIVHEPREGFEWTFEASAHGFTHGKYVVCQRLEPGEYRFVYANDSPVAVRFEITDPS